jgi:hypothetical protein
MCPQSRFDSGVLSTTGDIKAVAAKLIVKCVRASEQLALRVAADRQRQYAE